MRVLLDQKIKRVVIFLNVSSLDCTHDERNKYAKVFGTKGTPTSSDLQTESVFSPILKVMKGTGQQIKLVIHRFSYFPKNTLPFYYKSNILCGS